ncbi:MAG: hypothetical protein IMZ46_08675 [Acidobacteria bacterium]|nr:hypothetical protein [Acidobacteriota bacterium]
MMRTTMTVLALTSLLASLPAAPAFAQKPTLDSRLEVRFEATPAADVFRHIISVLGLELQLDANVDGPVTIWVKDVSARTALNVVCESLGCQWRVVGKRLVVGGSDSKIKWAGLATKDAAGRKKFVAMDLRSHLTKPLPVDMQFQDVPVSTVLRAISEVAGLEITADEPLASTHVTITASSKTVEDALEAVIEQAGPGTMTAFSVMKAGSDPAVRIKIAVKNPAVKIKK